MIYYFGYGTLASSEMMEAITGRKPEGSDFHLENYKLCIQNWNELPNHVREILSKKWNDNFRSYFIRPVKGKRVWGRLWSITPEERSLISRWEFWYEPIKIRTTTTNGDKIEVEADIINSFSIGQIVDSEHYEFFLNNKEKTLKAVKQIHTL